MLMFSSSWQLLSGLGWQNAAGSTINHGTLLMQLSMTRLRVLAAKFLTQCFSFRFFHEGLSSARPSFVLHAHSTDGPDSRTSRVYQIDSTLRDSGRLGGILSQVVATACTRRTIERPPWGHSGLSIVGQ